MSKQPAYIDPHAIAAAQSRITRLRGEFDGAKKLAAEFERLRNAVNRMQTIPEEIAQAETDLAALKEASIEYSLWCLGQPEVSLTVNPNTPDNVLAHRITVTFRSPVNGAPKVLALSDIAQGSIEEIALCRAEALPDCIARLANTPAAAMMRYRRGRSLGYLPSAIV